MLASGGRRSRVARASGILAASLVFGLLPAPAVAVDQRPDILVIVSDDQAMSMFSRSLMPAVFSQLVDRGMTFTKAYVNTPHCCPSRAEMLTGLYQHHNRVFLNNSVLRFPTVTTALQASGYRTMFAGKYLNSHDCSPLPEWTRWACVAGGASTYTKVNPLVNEDGAWVQEQGFTGRILADRVASFLAEDGSTPSFVWYAPPTPHTPQDDSRYRSFPVSIPPSPSYDEDPSDKPAYMQRGPLTMTQRWNWAFERNRMAQQVRALDDDIGRLLAALGDRAEQTMVIFLSDNGYLSGEHRRRGKGTPYEESVRVPFVIRYPPVLSTPATSEALVMNVDVASTLADLAGVTWVDDGRSLVPLLDGSATTVRDAVLISTCGGSIAVCRPGGTNAMAQSAAPGYWAVLNKSWKYVEYGNGEKELYNRILDPYELTNVVTRHPFVLQLMQYRLAQLRQAAPSDVP
jgi:arylsulfatase A-like enzyme